MIFARGGYGGCLTASVYWQFELLILKDPKVNTSQKSNELVSAGSGTTFRTLILELFDNTLKNSDRDSVPIPSPLTDSFELEFRTDVVTCETRSSEFFWNLEVFEYSDEVRRFAPLPRTVYLVPWAGSKTFTVTF